MSKFTLTSGLNESSLFKKKKTDCQKIDLIQDIYQKENVIISIIFSINSSILLFFNSFLAVNYNVLKDWKEGL